MNLANLPRIQKLFEKTQPVCFGRYVIDVPTETTVIVGPQEFGPRIETIPDGADKIAVLAEAKRNEVLQKSKTIDRAEIKDFAQGPTAGSWTLSFWETDTAQKAGVLDVIGYMPMGPHAVIYASTTAKSEGRTEDFLVSRLTSIAGNLRARTPNEIPTEPGVCLDLGFIADDSGKFQEIFGIGFRFPSLPGVSFSVSSNKDGEPSPPMSQRRREAEREVRGTPYEAEFRKVKVLRDGKYTVAKRRGEEALFKRPLEEGGYSHEFQFEVPGIRYDRNNPNLDAALYTGVEGNRPNAKGTDLTDEEAIALWDMLLSKLRLRVP